MVLAITETHVTELIFGAIKQMVTTHNWKYNDDISDTEKGRTDKEFKLRLTEVDNLGRSNSTALRWLGTFEITLYHNAEGDTEAGQIKLFRDIQDICFEIERFAPTGKFENVNSNFVETVNMLNWIPEPINVGDDSRIRTVLQYEIGYKIPNPIT